MAYLFQRATGRCQPHLGHGCRVARDNSNRAGLTHGEVRWIQAEIGKHALDAVASYGGDLVTEAPLHQCDVGAVVTPVELWDGSIDPRRCQVLLRASAPAHHEQIVTLGTVTGRSEIRKLLTIQRYFQ